MSSFEIGYDKQEDVIILTHCIASGGGDLTRNLQKFFFTKSMLCGTDPKHELLNSAQKRYRARITDLIERYNAKLSSNKVTHIIYGHTPYFEDAENIFNRKIHHITMLRDPVKRFISHYRSEINENNSLKDFKAWVQSVENGKNDHHGHNWVEFNHQTAMLSGYQSDITTKKDLKTAKDNLKNFTFVGLTEEFDESAALVSKIFSMPYTYRAPLTKYKAKHVVPIDSNVIQYIKEKSNFDIKLYEYAKKLYQKKRAQFQDTELLKPTSFDKFITYNIRDIDYWMGKLNIKIKNKLFNDIGNL